MENRRPWTPKEKALLGTMRDADLTKRLNRTFLSMRTQPLLKQTCVSSRRRAIGLRWSCGCSGGWQTAKSPGALDASWPRCAISEFSLESRVVRQSIDEPESASV